MPYLIDGHNVIGQMPGLSLADPDDEAKLAALVRRWCARENRKAVLIFDGGLPGGPSSLSNGDVAVIFASERHNTGDDLLLNRIRDEKNPTGLIVVSSDQRIVTAAKGRRMAVVPAREFGRALAGIPQAGKTAAKEQGLGGDEVAEWEKLFSTKKPG
jgi:predicted RNA-binding protein with PIN domain